MNGKYVSIDSILERIKRDTGLLVNVDKWDVVEWLFDFIDFVGAPLGYVHKVTDGNLDLKHPSPIIIDDYRGELPCDFHLCKACKTYPDYIPMVATTDLFHLSTYNLQDQVVASSIDYDLAAQHDSTIVYTTYSYELNSNYIFTDFQIGLVEMAYESFPTDENGYPMIPDNTRVIQGAVAFVGEKLARIQV